MAEAWRKVAACRMFSVPGGVFEVSTAGDVRLADGSLPTPSADRDGYLRVKHRGRWFPVHLLSILAWQGPPQVRHLGDGNQDNRPAKLAWGSARENKRDERGKRSGMEGGVSLPSQLLQPVTGDVLR